MPNGSVNEHIFRYTPARQWLDGDRSMSDYTGKINILNFDGTSLGISIMSDGELVRPNGDEDTSSTRGACSYEYEYKLCVGGYDGKMHCTLYFRFAGCGGGSGGGSGGFSGGFPDNGGSGNGSEGNTDGSGGHGGGGGSGYGNGDGSDGGSSGFGGGNPIIDDNGDLIEKEIVVEIKNNLTGKALCAYNRLVGTTTTTENYYNMMTQLFIEFGAGNIGNADLNFQIGEIGFTGGQSNRIAGGNDKFSITLSPDMNDKSSIQIAKVLVHEMAHAFLAKHYSLYNKSFEELYIKYINNTGINNYSHDIMKDKFINRMADQLYEFDSTIFPDRDDYKILASEGVYDLNSAQKAELNRVKVLASNNDNNCND